MALRDRLDAARHDHFVGRQSECARFREAVTADALPFHVLAVHGPGGVGKSTLLRAFVRMCRDEAIPTLQVDARGIDGPAAFERAVAPLMVLGYNGGDGAPARSGRRVLLIDHAEAVRPLEPWLRDSFLPEIDEDVFVVLAGRYPPEPAWTTDLGWKQELVVMPLRNFEPEESAAFLKTYGVPAGQHDAVRRVTHGHPMALALAAERAAQHPGEVAEAARSPDVVRTLLERFLEEAPSHAHRTALEAAALVRNLTEALLDDVLETGARTLFEWMRGLSFVETGPRGLVLHDLAREVVTADLRWSAPERYASLHELARQHYTHRLQHIDADAERQHLLAEYVHLYRDNPVVAPLFDRLRAEWQRSGALTAEPLRPEDAPAVTRLVARHEGDASAEWAEAWLREQPEHTEVFRSDGGLAGFLLPVLLDAEPNGDATDDDPAIAAAREYLRRHAPLRAGELALYFRFWMDAEAYQQVSAAQSMAFARTVRFYLGTPSLAFSFICCADADLWGLIFQFAGLKPLPEAAFMVGEERYHVFGHDWRVEPPDAWLSALAQRMPDQAPRPPAERAEPLIVLSRTDFAEAVADALRHFVRPQRLAETPLLRSRLVASQAEDPEDRVAALLQLLKDAAGPLAESPREAPYFRALHTTYFQPARTQAVAAEIIGVPFSTYRRHLKRGVEHVVETLWRQEVDG
jgi:hypothetical protein